MKKHSPSNFETDLAELEQLVARMERGDLPLEEALGAFERGVRLARSCQQALREAEQKVQQLSADSNGETLAPLADGDENAADDGEDPDQDEL